MFDYSVDDIVLINIQVGETGKLLKHDALHSAFASVDYFDSTIEKIASVGRSIMQNHPFIDGNKRTGIVFMIACCNAEGVHMSKKSDAQIVSFATTSVLNAWSVHQIAAWLQHG